MTNKMSGEALNRRSYDVDILSLNLRLNLLIFIVEKFLNQLPASFTSVHSVSR